MVTLLYLNWMLLVQMLTGFLIQYPPRECGIGEGSWAGVCLSPVRWSTAIVAHGFSKSVDVYDQDIHLRSLHTLWYPAALSLQSSLSADENSIVAVGEGSQLSIWDLRTNHNGGCIQRVCGAIGELICCLQFSIWGYCSWWIRSHRNHL
ncbi:Uncharacterized protein M6B38_212115 [Iris pallida]|uniref:Uncharacterized protein n=1 Tax=Iris pallida TaxID=29817 RepID=A0AAX6E3C5_IRIPA|nr:Uncharacterized protein M6B38_212115 [Iris pallida]